ncbi:hypothetical protein NYZ60_06105 [Acinetobacter baumannii]|nr:hypothetical protein [Acinetobacter baumannii]
MSHFRPGQLAVLANDDQKSNIGKVVSLVRWHESKKDTSGNTHHDVWVVDCNDGLETSTGNYSYTNVFVYAKDLQPLVKEPSHG